MAHEHDDKAFERFLQEQSPISRLYQKARDRHAEQPPKAIDEAVVAAAHKATQDTGAESGGTKRSWYVPTSIAAVLAMSFVLVIYYRHEQPAFVPDQSETQLADQQAPAPASEPATGMAPTEQAARTPETPSQTRTKASNDQRALQEKTELAKKGEAREPARHAAQADTATVAVEPVTKPPFEDPRVWLEHIARLLNNGKRDQAIVQLEAFREDYPDYKLDKFPEVQQLARALDEGGIE